MKKLFVQFLFLVIVCFLASCAGVKSTITNQYKLQAYSGKTLYKQKTPHSLLISMPDAVAGYQTEQMLYTNQPYELSAFAHNAWVSSPANMLYPLMLQSLQKSNYFYAVAAGPDADKTDYRLDTQLLMLQQNFLTKPSIVEFKVQAVLTHIEDNRVVASKMFLQKIKCPTDTPYGGVIAANNAVRAFTAELTDFVIFQVSHDVREWHR